MVHHETEDLFTLAPAAVEKVRDWLEDSRQYTPDYAARQLAGVLASENGLQFTRDFVDQVIRPEDPAVAARALAGLSRRIPEHLPWYLKFALSAARVAPAVPHVVVPAARAALRKMVSHLIVDASEDRLGPTLEKLAGPGTRLNINLLGEAVLGRVEAARRMASTRKLIRRADVDYVSVKVSAAIAPHNPWAFDEAVEQITAELVPLFELAQTHGTFINLDMEEYHDLDLTLAVFRGVLDTPELQGSEAGIVLQAYLPDALGAMEELQHWAARRVDAGGAPVKVRVVKGANLPMEQASSSTTGWPLATFSSKQDTDTHYKRILNWAMRPEHTRHVRIGVAGHNLFDLALAWLLSQHRGLTTAGARPEVEFEMLFGMATTQAEAVRDEIGSLLLYTPVVHPEEFDVALTYLVRRLDEGASEDNFMSAVFDLDDPALFNRERQRFLNSLDALRHHDDDGAAEHHVAATHRVQDRSRNHLGPVPDPREGFANRPDTDPSIAANRAWARDILSRAADSDLGVAEVREARVSAPGQIDAAVTNAVSAGETWCDLPTEVRADILRTVAETLEAHRGELIEVAAAEAGKTIDQSDPEVSEAIDFANYYAHLAEQLEQVRGADFHPSRLVAVVPPWNFPIAIPVGGVTAVLASGAPVVVKPAPQSERTGTLAFSLIRRGLAEGLASHQVAAGPDEAAVLAEALLTVLTIAAEDEPRLGSRLIENPDVERVILTGGYDTAALFRSMRPELPLLAETSGKNALIVTPSADMDLAAGDAVASAFGHAGQKCSAASLVILVGSAARSHRFHRQLVDAVTSLHVGYPQDPRSQMGPTIEPPGEKLHRGLTELGPGEHWVIEPRPLDNTGQLFSPGVRFGIQPGADAHLTEYFGPMLGIMTADTLDEAIEYANAVDYGLTSGLHSLDVAEIDTWLESIQAGNLYVNRGITGAVVRRQPFGGWKRSSVGAGTKAGGPHYLHGLGTWTDTSDAPLATRTSPGTHASSPQPDESWLTAALADDERVWGETFGAARDISGLSAERNVLRYCPVPVHIRWDSGPAVHLHRVVAAGIRAGSELTVSLPAPAPQLPETLAELLSESHTVTVLTETTEEFHRRAARLNGAECPRIRLITDISLQRTPGARTDTPETDTPEKALSYAIDGSPDVAIYAGAVTSAGDVELLPFLQEQAISITAHRFGTPDHLTDDIL